MKKIVFCLLATASMMLFLSRTNAQINLEHTFEGDVCYSGTAIHDWPYQMGDAGFFIFQDYENYQLKLYNTDYSLYKSISLIQFQEYPDFWAYLFTKKLFNTDDKIEFLLHLSIYNDENRERRLLILNEDGAILKDFGNYENDGPVPILKINEQYKLVIYRYENDNATTEIYSLPGTMSNAVLQIGGNIFQPPYPNPANSTITLPYQLKQGEISTMRIYNMNGQLVETKQIDSAFDKILLNVSNYRRGMYIYEVNGESKRFIVK